MLRAAARHDLSQRAPDAGNREAGHVSSRATAEPELRIYLLSCGSPVTLLCGAQVSNASAKAPLRALLLDEALGLAAELRRLRTSLGYTADGPHAGAVDRRAAWAAEAPSPVPPSPTDDRP